VNSIQGDTGYRRQSGHRLGLIGNAQLLGGVVSFINQLKWQLKIVMPVIRKLLTPTFVTYDDEIFSKLFD
jgi:hypothetical protein